LGAIEIKRSDDLQMAFQRMKLVWTCSSQTLPCFRSVSQVALDQRSLQLQTLTSENYTPVKKQPKTKTKTKTKTKKKQKKQGAELMKKD
jgi:hypothetical protein